MNNDAISRTALLRKTRPIPNLVVKRFGDEWQVEMVTLEDIVDAPALDVAPVVHARWIAIRMAGERVAIQCSACRNYDNPSKVRGNYCWYCGAKMDGDIDG